MIHVRIDLFHLIHTVVIYGTAWTWILTTVDCNWSQLQSVVAVWSWRWSISKVSSKYIQTIPSFLIFLINITHLQFPQYPHPKAKFKSHSHSTIQWNSISVFKPSSMLGWLGRSLYSPQGFKPVCWGNEGNDKRTDLRCMFLNQSAQRKTMEGWGEHANST